tara:strand:+ start:552 stop:782 length:231 start_codon:yes stop_codon:yes gene_type:complete
MPTTTTKNLMVQLSVPITLLDIEVEELTPEAILNAVANDLRDDNSINEWEATWDDLKSAVRNGEVEIIDDGYAVIR